MTIPAVLIGNVGQEPTTTQTKTGKTVTRLRLACNDSYRDAAGQFQDRTTFWVTLQGWNHIADAMSSYETGDHLVVVGEWRQDDYERDGQTRSARYVDVAAIGRNDAVATAATDESEDQPAVDEGEGDDEVENPL